MRNEDSLKKQSKMIWRSYQ